MSVAKPMGSLRRGPIPGMNNTSATGSPASTRPTEPPEPELASAPTAAEASAAAAQPAAGRWPSADYSATRLANFRLPVDLHDRYRQLVRDVELRHPRLRRPNLTEVIIALLEEGPSTVDEVAELIRRKRAHEHSEGV